MKVSKFVVMNLSGPQLDEFRVRNQSLLIGGEACLWTEYADDDSIMARLWLVDLLFVNLLV